MTNTKHNLRPKVEDEALDLIAFSKEEEDMDVKELSILLKTLITGDKIFEDWDWRIAKYIEEKMGAVLMEEGKQRFYEPETLGLPPEDIKENKSPFNYKITDHDYLLALFQAVQDIAENIPEHISKFLALPNRQGWPCQGQGCSRIFDKKLDTYDEVREFIANFSIGKYRQCWSCQNFNWFEIDEMGAIKFLQLVDKTFSKA